MTTTLATRQPHHPTRPPHPGTHPRGAEGPGGPADGECAVILMATSEHAGGSADDEVLHELAEHGLRNYTAQVAAALGAGPEAAWSEWADAPSAYIALDHRLSAHPGRDTALIWAAERGWAVAVETGCGEDLLIIASLGGDVLPVPEAVAVWARAVLAGRLADARGCARAAVGANLARRLAGWAGHELTVDDRTG